MRYERIELDLIAHASQKYIVRARVVAASGKAIDRIAKEKSLEKAQEEATKQAKEAFEEEFGADESTESAEAEEPPEKPSASSSEAKEEQLREQLNTLPEKHGRTPEEIAAAQAIVDAIQIETNCDVKDNDCESQVDEASTSSACMACGGKQLVEEVGYAQLQPCPLCARPKGNASPMICAICEKMVVDCNCNDPEGAVAWVREEQTKDVKNNDCDGQVDDVQTPAPQVDPTPATEDLEPVPSDPASTPEPPQPTMVTLRERYPALAQMLTDLGAEEIAVSIDPEERHSKAREMLLKVVNEGTWGMGGKLNLYDLKLICHYLHGVHQAKDLTAEVMEQLADQIAAGPTEDDLQVAALQENFLQTNDHSRGINEKGFMAVAETPWAVVLVNEVLREFLQGQEAA